MSPIVHGKMYGEVESSFLLRHALRVLIEPASIAKVSFSLREIDTLVHYLRDLKLPCSIEVLLPAAPPGHFDAEYAAMREYNAEILRSSTIVVPEVDKVFPARSDFPSSVAELASNALIGDADLVVSEELASQPETVNRFKELNTSLVSADQAKQCCEVFVRGHDVPWTFSHPIWGAPWTPFYVVTDPDIKVMKELLDISFRKDVSPTVRERIRSLSINRWSAIVYTRDKLLFYVMQRRAAKREKITRQNFSFELAYHLNHYFLLFWGAIDSVCWIVNGICDLGFKPQQWREVGVKKNKFITRLRECDPEMVKEFEKDDFLRWINVLERVRHFVAHEGTATLSPLLEKPAKELTEEELDKEVEKMPEWKESAALLPPSMMEAFRETFRMDWKERNYKLISDAAFVIPGPTDTALKFPLESIEWEYERFREFALGVARKCMDRLATTTVERRG